jgi:diguanylate cyclase (GGDEF)-like protein
MAVTGLLLALVAGALASTLTHVGGRPVKVGIRDWVTPSVYVLVGAVVCWRAIRTTRARVSWRIWLDGVIAGLGVAAIGATIPTGPAYDVGVLLLALVAWQPVVAPDAGKAAPGAAVLGIPAALTLSALGLLIYDHFVRLDPLALTLALATLLGAFARTWLAFGDLRALAETRRQALTDELTEMPNRRHFLRRLNRAILASSASGTSVALLLFDLDHFKELNDTLGHDAGDRLLCQVGERLHTVLRAGDVAARLGGDEFGVLLGGPCDVTQAETVADKILGAIAKPFPIKGLSLRVTASVGIALFPEHARDGEQLMQHADIAMYDAKSKQCGRACYASERDNHSLERLTLAGELSRALEGEELQAHFQPKADARSGTIVGVEALARWIHPERGTIAPDQFIAVAEQAGLGRALTRRMLELALTQVKAWRDAGLDLHVAVNTTVADLLDASFPAEVAATLARHGLPPDALVLEVTENMVLSDPVRIGDVLAQLGELGLGLSLDDFGTGYSSLTHLKALPVGEVKIDRSFVARMTSDPVDAAIVEATIQLAHSIGSRVVAEGIEDHTTWSSLVANRCELVQGYALSRPLPAAELEGLLRAEPVPTKPIALRSAAADRLPAAERPGRAR